MPSNYSQYKIELQATGENSGTWGTITNANFGSATPGVYQGFEQAIGGRADVTMSTTTVTLTLTDTNAAQDARALYLNLSGTPGGAADLVVPALQKAYLVKNGTNAVVTIKVTGQTGVPIPVGKTVWVYNNGTDVVTAVDHIPSLTLGAALPVASGGTGITSLGTGVATALGQNVTGSGGIALATSPTFTTPTLGVATATSVNKVAITAPATSATLTLANGSTLATSGANSLTLTTTGTTNVTLPTSGTLATTAGTVASFSAGTTGLTPNTATTGAVTLGGTLAVANGGTGVTTSTGSGSVVLSTSPTLTTPNLGTPSAATLTNATGLPTAGLVDNAVTNAKLRDSAALSVIGRSANTTGDPADIAAGTDHQVLRRSGTALGFGAVALNQAAAITGTLPVGNGGTGITSFGTGVATALGQNVTGSGGIALSTSPTFTTPTLGAATATSVNGLTITSTTGTLTLVNGSTLATAGANSLTLTTTGATNVTLPTSGTLATTAGTVASFSAGTTGFTPNTATTGAVTLGGTLAPANGGTGVNNATRTLTINSNAGTLNFTAASKTLGISNSLTLAGTDATTMTFPSTSATIARTDAGQTFTGVQVMTSPRILTSINDTNGNELIGVTATTSAVNEITVANAATTNSPTISATGGDTNIGINITPKGTGRTTVTQLTTTSPRVLTSINDTNGNELFGVTATGSAVNEFTVANAATGNAPTLSATGGDTNIGMRLQPKGTGGVVFNAGAVGTPSITTTGDLNTGIYFPAADTIGFVEGGAEAMRIDSSGNVGIGVTPVSQNGKVLQIDGGAGAADFRLTNTATGSAKDNGTLLGLFGSDTYLWNLENAFLSLGTNNAERMRITSGGNVGIGTTSPGDKLVVSGNISATGYLKGGAVFASSGFVNETQTISTAAMVYSFNKDQGGAGGSSTTTFNITGLSNTDGAFAFIHVRASNTAAGINAVAKVQVHGTEVFSDNAQNNTKTAVFFVCRQNGSWVAGPVSPGTTRTFP